MIPHFDTPEMALSHYLPDGMAPPTPDSFVSLDIDNLFAKTSKIISRAHPKDRLNFISKLFEDHALSVYSVLAPTDFYIFS